jgi:excinuclease ABC subunit C
VPLAFTDQPELFPVDRSPKCLRFELGTCRGPCVRECSRREYSAGVRGAKAFLDGRDRNLLHSLRVMMTRAAESLEFERALALRDRLRSLERIDVRLSMLRSARERNTFVYPVAGHDERTRWYLIRRGQVVAVSFAPCTSGENVELPRHFAASFAAPVADALPTERTVDSVLLVEGWFRKSTGERAKLLPASELDGGQTPIARAV